MVQNTPEAYALAVRHHREGRLHDAEPLYRQILEADPGHGGAWYHLGVISSQLGNPRGAVECFERAVAASPTLAEGHHQLGNALSLQGKHDHAIACYQRAIELKPDFPEAYNDLGLAFRACGKLQEAEECYRRALESRREFVDAHNNLGNVLKDAGRLDQAMAYYRRALRFNPDFAEAHNNLGIVLKERGRLDESLACFQRALELKPDFDVAHSNYLYTHQYQHGITPAKLAAIHGEYDRQHAAPLRPFRPLHENDRSPERRLRLGFVSRDFGRHPVGFFLIRLLENLERDLCEIVCYSDRTYNDSLAARFHAAATLWREVGAMDHARLAETIRTDQIDVLFDLGGHTAHNRLLVFARKPAPVQITWLGYEGTTGLEAMDYILADAWTIPHEDELWFREAVLRMPAGYVCYDPPAMAPAVAPIPAANNGFVVFGSFNNLAKITPQVVEVWAQVLERVPGSRLKLKYGGLHVESVRRRYMAMFARQGVDTSRLELLPSSPYTEYFSAYDDVDLVLDPFPFGGGVTTCHALWMGVPVITCPGLTFASRHGLSYLSSLGVRETIAGSREEYVELAVALATDLSRLAMLRSGLREQMAASRLCDGKRFAADFLQAARQAWRTWCQA